MFMLGKRGGMGRFMLFWSVIFVILVIIGVLVAGFYIIDFVNSNQKSITETTSNIQNNLRQESYNYLVKYIFQKNNLFDDKRSPILISDNQVFFDSSIAEGAAFIYTNCDSSSYECQKLPRNYQQPLENQFNLRPIKEIVKTKDNDNNQVLILIPILPDTVLLNIPVYSSLPKDLEIYQEINEQYRALHLKVFNQKSPAITEKSQFFFLSDYYFEQTKDATIFYVELGLKLGKLGDSLQVAEEEYEYAGNFTQERLNRYRQTIEKYYPRAQQVLQKNIGELPDFKASILFELTHCETLFDCSLNKLSSKSTIVETLTDLGRQLHEMKQTHRENNINEAYLQKDLPESEMSKLLRLKILQVRIAKTLLLSCEEERDRQSCLLATLSCNAGDDVGNCVLNFLYEINSADLCRGVSRNVDSDQCLRHFSAQDPSLCLKIRDAYLYSQCRSEALAHE